MSIKMWYYKHFDRDKLLEELSKPVEGDYVVVKEGNTLTRIRKEELDSYMEFKRQRAERMLNEYNDYVSSSKRQ
jgi:hydrogenase maturation factor